MIKEWHIARLWYRPWLRLEELRALSQYGWTVDAVMYWPPEAWPVARVSLWRRYARVVTALDDVRSQLESYIAGVRAAIVKDASPENAKADAMRGWSQLVDDAGVRYSDLLNLTRHSPISSTALWPLRHPLREWVDEGKRLIRIGVELADDEERRLEEAVKWDRSFLKLLGELYDYEDLMAHGGDFEASTGRPWPGSPAAECRKMAAEEWEAFWEHLRRRLTVVDPSVSRRRPPGLTKPPLTTAELVERLEKVCRRSMELLDEAVSREHERRAAAGGPRASNGARAGPTGGASQKSAAALEIREVYETGERVTKTRREKTVRAAQVRRRGKRNATDPPPEASTAGNKGIRPPPPSPTALSPKQKVALALERAGDTHAIIAAKMGIKHRQSAMRLLQRARAAEQALIKSAVQLLGGGAVPPPAGGSSPTPVHQSAQSNGPASPSSFRWDGRPVEVRPKSWALASHVWKQPERSCELEGAGLVIWGPDWTRAKIEKAVWHFNNAMMENGVRVSLHIKAGAVYLDIPPL